jgi:hypothetical protein
MSAIESIRNAALAAASRMAEARRRRQTLRTLESLDLHIQKDIGWVSGLPDDSHRRR